MSKTTAAEALYPTLSVFHSVSGHPLKGVWQIRAQGSVEKLVLGFGAQVLVVTADANDDSLDVDVAASADFQDADRVDVSDVAPWDAYAGKSFGWGWIAINQQGYCDGMLLSFEGIIPQLILNVVASSIKVGVVGPLA